MLIEIHMLKNYPPVNLNRDESGMPKSCFFGGVQRGRISSQCLKRSWRTSEIFKQLGSYGIRTRCMPEMVAERLTEMGVSREFVEEAQKKLTGIANKEGKASDKGITSQVVFYAKNEIEHIASEMKKLIDEETNIKAFQKKALKDMSGLATKKPVTADIALFGRMVTSDYLADVDASMQVAHAISTHAVNRESDYFTAVDDLLDAGDENGAAMIGDIDYNSCCYYEYASIDTDALNENLSGVENREELVRTLIPVLLRAMAFSNPTGKQNTFAGQVVPDMVLVECKRDKIPLSYVNAFEEPVPTWGSNPQVIRNSVKRLVDHIDVMDNAYALPILHRACFGPRFKEMGPAKGERFDSFEQLLSACVKWMNEGDQA